MILTLTTRKLPAFVCNILQATWLERVPVLMSWQELPGLGPLTFHQKGRSPSSAWWGCGSSPFYVLQCTVKPLERVHTVNYLLTLKLAGWGILCPISWLGFIVGVRLVKPFQCQSKSPRGCGPACRTGLLFAVCRFEDYFGSSNNRERMKEPSACIVRMFIFAWNRMICKDASTTQQSWITRLTFSFLQNKRSVLIEKILLFWKKEWGRHCSCFTFYQLLGPIASSSARLFPLFRTTECCCTCYVLPSVQQLGAIISSQTSARPWLGSFLFSESKNELSISLALHLTIDLEPQFLPK